MFDIFMRLFGPWDPFPLDPDRNVVQKLGIQSPWAWILAPFRHLCFANAVCRAHMCSADSTVCCLQNTNFHTEPISKLTGSGYPIFARILNLIRFQWNGSQVQGKLNYTSARPQTAGFFWNSSSNNSRGSSNHTCFNSNYMCFRYSWRKSPGRTFQFHNGNITLRRWKSL